jgi:hypothetical protein
MLLNLENKKELNQESEEIQINQHNESWKKKLLRE